MVHQKFKINDRRVKYFGKVFFFLKIHYTIEIEKIRPTYSSKFNFINISTETCKPNVFYQDIVNQNNTF